MERERATTYGADTYFLRRSVTPPNVAREEIRLVSASGGPTIGRAEPARHLKFSTDARAGDKRDPTLAHARVGAFSATSSSSWTGTGGRTRRRRGVSPSSLTRRRPGPIRHGRATRPFRPVVDAQVSTERYDTGRPVMAVCGGTFPSSTPAQLDEPSEASPAPPVSPTTMPGMGEAPERRIATRGPRYRSSRRVVVSGATSRTVFGCTPRRSAVRPGLVTPRGTRDQNESERSLISVDSRDVEARFEVALHELRV